MTDVTSPNFAFRFKVTFRQENIGGTQRSAVPLCAGAFSEVSGLEATMTPKSIPEGGRNYGLHQRVGQVDFATVILKRGVTQSRDAWRWFQLVNVQAASAYRLNVLVEMLDINNRPIATWKLLRALPVKFKMADLVATQSSEVAIEELHLVHEGFEMERPRR